MHIGSRSEGAVFPLDFETLPIGVKISVRKFQLFGPGPKPNWFLLPIVTPNI